MTLPGEIDAEAQIANLEAELRNVYRERAHFVALLSAMVPGCLAYTDPDTPQWPVLTLDGGPEGQMSWHIAPDDLDLFAHMPLDENVIPWDGHSTDEKYERLRTMTGFMVELRDAGLYGLVGEFLTRAEEDQEQEQAAQAAPQEPQEAAPVPKPGPKPRAPRTKTQGA